MLTDDEIARFRTMLLEERARLAAEDGASAGERATVMLDQQSVGRLSRMDAMQRQAMAHATARRRREREMRIASALQRVDDGEFGYCHECGEEISVERLNLDPTLPTCVSCARG